MSDIAQSMLPYCSKGSKSEIIAALADCSGAAGEAIVRGNVKLFRNRGFRQKCPTTRYMLRNFYGGDMFGYKGFSRFTSSF